MPLQIAASMNDGFYIAGTGNALVNDPVVAMDDFTNIFLAKLRYDLPGSWKKPKAIGRFVKLKAEFPRCGGIGSFDVRFDRTKIV
jgi:hypothetical protein